MKLLSCVLLALGISQLQAGVILKSVNVDGRTGSSGGLRQNGDIWGPPVAGSNKLKCGVFGNTDIAGTRLQASTADTLIMTVNFSELKGNAQLTAEVTYGAAPNMLMHPGYKLLDPLPITSSEKSATINVPLSTLPYSNLATMMIGLEVEGGDTHFQCVDMELSGGTQFTVPGDGYGDPDAASPTAPPDGAQNRVLVVAPGEEGLETIHYILFIVVALLLICFIITWIKYKSPGDEAPPAQFAPQLAMTENIQDPAEPEGFAEKAPPIREIDSDPEPEAKPARPVQIPPKEASEEIKSGDESGDAGDGSKGRHFHFRYVE